MNKISKTSLIITLTASLLGVLLKLNGVKALGDVFLATGVITWLVFAIDFIYRFINRKSLLPE